MRSRGLHPSVLLALDVDGTIARVYREEEYADHANDPGWTSWMTVDDSVIDALDSVAKRSDVQVAWLTTWSPEQVGWLIRGPLVGKLVGPYVSHRNWPRSGWRLQSLVSFVREGRFSAVVWADDRADDEASRQLRRLVDVPVLVVAPDKFLGLTQTDVAEIRRFVDKHHRT